MARTIVRLAIAAVMAGGLAACAGTSGNLDTGVLQGRVPDAARDSAVLVPVTPLECVPFARVHSGIEIYGDAYTWWDKAAGHFARGSDPKPGAVLVLNGYAGPNRAHLAVVHDILSAREIRVDHANWLDDGAIYVMDPVIDVSPQNDWSEVKVWNARANVWGTRIYNVQGFIGPVQDHGTTLVAHNGRASSGDAAQTSDEDSDTSSWPDTSHDADEADHEGIPTR